MLVGADLVDIYWVSCLGGSLYFSYLSIYTPDLV